MKYKNLIPFPTLQCSHFHPLIFSMVTHISCSLILYMKIGFGYFYLNISKDFSKLSLFPLIGCSLLIGIYDPHHKHVTVSITTFTNIKSYVYFIFKWFTLNFLLFFTLISTLCCLEHTISDAWLSLFLLV